MTPFQGRNEGGHDSLQRAPKSPTITRSFFNTVRLHPKDLRGSNTERQTCLLPWAPFNLVTPLKNYIFTVRFSFLPAPGHAVFWKIMSVVARCSNSENTDATDAQSRTLSGVVVCNVCKSVLKYDCKKTGSSHIKRHTEGCKLSLWNVIFLKKKRNYPQWRYRHKRNYLR